MKKSTLKHTPWLTRSWLQRFWIWYSRLTTTNSFEREPMKLRRHWIETNLSWLLWLQMQNPLRSYCIFLFSVKTRTFHMCSWDPNMLWVEHVESQGKSLPVHFCNRKALNSRHRFSLFRLRLRSFWFKSWLNLTWNTFCHYSLFCHYLWTNK